MKAIRLHYRPVRYLAARYGSRWRPGLGFGPLGFVQLDGVEEPAVPGPEWVRLRPLMSGVCGSDLAAVTGGDSFMLAPFAAFPFTLGHENVALVEQVGEAVRGWSEGDRVVVNPVLACRQRGIEPACDACRRGEYGLCRNFDDAGLGAGFSTGYCRRVGGGWSESFAAHASQLHRVDDLSDEVAVLTDALASAARPVLLHPPREGERVLVIGAGSIGLLTIAALCASGWRGSIAVAARHAFQRELARRAGGDPVLGDREEIFEWAAALPDARSYAPDFAPRYVEGGPALVYDTVGSQTSLQDSLALTREGGRVVLVGGAARAAVDWTRVWYRQLTIAGVIAYGRAPWNGELVDSYVPAIDMIRSGALDGLDLVTHTFALDDYRAALATALSKNGSGAVKVAFRPGQ